MRIKLLSLALLTTSFAYAQSWNLTGNSGIDSSTNFIGTTDAKDFVIKTNSIERIRINPSGNIGIGIAPSPNRALNFFGNTEFVTDVTSRDSYHFFNNAQNINGGMDLMWLKYDKYQSNDIGILTLSTPLSSGDWAKPVFSVRNSGKVFIGIAWDNYALSGCSDCNSYRLFVRDGIKAEKVKVDIASANGWADYVFKKHYKLNTLDEVEKYITENGHLPNIPSAEEVVKNGINLGEMDAKLLEKIEELTLYSIGQSKQLKSQQEQIERLQQENKTLKSQAEKIEKLEQQVLQLLKNKDL